MPHTYPKLNGTERAGPGLGAPLASGLRDRVMLGVDQNHSKSLCDALGSGTSHLHKQQHTIKPCSAIHPHPSTKEKASGLWIFSYFTKISIKPLEQSETQPEGVRN